MCAGRDGTLPREAARARQEPADPPQPEHTVCGLAGARGQDPAEEVPVLPLAQVGQPQGGSIPHAGAPCRHPTQGEGPGAPRTFRFPVSERDGDKSILVSPASLDAETSDTHQLAMRQ